jgi:hypothetical protein
MKDLVAKEIVFLLAAVLLAVPAGLLFSYLVQLDPGAQNSVPMDAVVFEVELLIIGGLIGFIGAYLMRLVVWAVKVLMV